MGEVPPRRRAATRELGGRMNRWRGSTLAGLIALGLVVGGCGQSPLGPGDQLANSAFAPPIASFAPDGSLGYIPAAGDSLPADEPDSLAERPNAVKVSERVECDRGAYMRAGRFSLKIPAGALAENAVGTLSM